MGYEPPGSFGDFRRLSELFGCRDVRASCHPIESLEFRGLGFKVWGLGFRDQGLGFRVWGLRVMSLLGAFGTSGGLGF